MTSPLDTMLLLRSLPLFERLTNAQFLALADIVVETDVRQGTVVVAAGAMDTTMYFVVAGEFQVLRSGLEIARFGAGDFFGEMALLENAPRSADVVAATDARLLALERNDLYRLMRALPGIAIAMCQALSARIRATTARFT